MKEERMLNNSIQINWTTNEARYCWSNYTITGYNGKWILLVWTFVVWIYFWFNLMDFDMTNIFPYHFIRRNDCTNFIFFYYFKWTWIFHELDKIIWINSCSNWNASITICYFVTFLFAKSTSMFFPHFGPDLYQRINTWILFPFFCSMID